MTEQIHSEGPMGGPAASPSTTLLRSRALQAATDLFTAYGLKLGPASVQAELLSLQDVAFLSISGFAGPGFSGFIVLGTTERMLTRSNPSKSSPCDWMGEIGNQLLGRLKNLLLRDGIPIGRVPSAVVKGHGAALLYARAGVRPMALMSADGNTVFLWTETEPSVEEHDGLARPLETEVLAEGDMLLF